MSTSNSVNISTDRYWDGNSGNPVSLDTLARFEYDGVNYIYDLEPAQNNLFWAGNFSSGNGDKGGEDYKRREFSNSQFRIQSIAFNAPTLSFSSEPNVTHMEYLTGATLSKQVTITWLEDVYHSVQKYH